MSAQVAGTSVDWATFLAARAERRQRALSLAEAHLDGKPLAPREVFGAWRFADDERLGRLALDELLGRVPSPPPARAWALLAPDGDLPGDDGVRRSARLHLRRLLERRSRVGVQGEREAWAWAFAELDQLGHSVEDRERAAWRRVAYPAQPEQDGRAAGIWASWFSGNPWGLREVWEALYLAPASRSFLAICEARDLPADVRRRVLDDLREGFFYRLLGASDSVPGWAELAVRVVETGGTGPVDALAMALSAADWDRVMGCALRRGEWRRTGAVVWAELHEVAARARAASQQGQADPAHLEALLDLHVVRRVVSSWQREPVPNPWSVVVQNRGRARGRIRAVLSTRPALLDVLMSLDGLHARTEAAVRRYAWAWAWQELATDFAFDVSRSVTPPCLGPEPTLEGLAPDERPSLRTWVLLVVLRGRFDHLERWVRTGGTGDRDSTWARLLAEALPVGLCDPDQGRAKRARTYHRLRTELAESLPDITTELAPLLADIAGLPPGRKLRAAFEERVGPTWNAAVPVPRSGFPTFVRNARAVHAAWTARLEDPCRQP